MHGRRLRGNWGTAPKFEVGYGPRIRPPNILSSSVIESVAKHEVSKKRCQEENVCSEIDVLYQEKGHIIVSYRRHNANIIMTSSQDDAIIISFGSFLHLCRRLQTEESRNKYAGKNDEKTFKDGEDIKDIEADAKR